MDLPATLATIGHAQLSAHDSPDSLDLSPVLLGQTTADLRDHTVLHGISDTLAVRMGDWKYIPANTRGPPAGTGGADPSEARFTPNRVAAPLLFNLRDDPGEQRNVFAEFPEKAAELQRKLDEIRRKKP